MRKYCLFDIVALNEDPLKRYPYLKGVHGTIVDFEGDSAYWVEFADEKGVTILLDVFDESELWATTSVEKVVYG
jgi:hypothetical protein